MCGFVYNRGGGGVFNNRGSGLDSKSFSFSLGLGTRGHRSAKGQPKTPTQSAQRRLRITSPLQTKRGSPRNPRFRKCFIASPFIRSSHSPIRTSPNGPKRDGPSSRGPRSSVEAPLLLWPCDCSWAPGRYQNHNGLQNRGKQVTKHGRGSRLKRGHKKNPRGLTCTSSSGVCYCIAVQYQDLGPLRQGS